MAGDLQEFKRMEERVHLHNLPQQNNRLSCVKLLKRRQYECVLLARIETELARLHTQYTHTCSLAHVEVVSVTLDVSRGVNTSFMCVRARALFLSMCEVDAR